jgi:hypothetical protein
MIGMTLTSKEFQTSNGNWGAPSKVDFANPLKTGIYSKPDHEPYEETRFTVALGYGGSRAAFDDRMSTHDLLGLLWNKKTWSHPVCRWLIWPSHFPEFQDSAAHRSQSPQLRRIMQDPLQPLRVQIIYRSQPRITLHQKCVSVDASLLLWALVQHMCCETPSLFSRQSILHVRGTMTP